MKTNRCIIRTALAAAILSIGAGFVPAHAQVNVNINIGPPAPQYEIVPAVGPGYTWAPGYWAWQGQDYRWVRGHQIAQRPGHRWVADHWEEGNRYRAGYWVPVAHRGDDDRDYEDHDRGKGHKHKDKDKDQDRGDHCPPGQAKKGNC